MSRIFNVFFILWSAGWLIEGAPSSGDQLWLGKAISKDWFFRDSQTPPIREIINPDLAHEDESRGKKTFEFSAFGKLWRLSGTKNSALFDDNTRFETRTESGQTLTSVPWTSDNCFYVGSATAGETEAGVAAFSTCHGLRALIVTNQNDYVIQPARTDIARSGAQAAHKEPHHFKIENRGHATHPFSEVPRDPFAKSPILDPLTGPPIPKPKSKDDAVTFDGSENRKREIAIELGIIVDQEYVETVKRDESTDPEWIHFHLLERLNWVQVWYIHPTFGYVWWWHVSKVVINDKVIDYAKYEGENWDTLIDKVCNWQSQHQPDSDQWDHVLIFSSKPNIWGTRPNGEEYIGRAMADGACDRRRHCVGVKDMNFQWGTWTRLAAHENAHDFGIPDDYPESGSSTSAECFAGLMRQGVYQDHEWGRCSIDKFESWRRVSGKCLDTSPTMTSPNMTMPDVNVNVAYRATAEQSSRFGLAEEFGAHKATDGPLLGVPQGETPVLASCTQTQRQKDPFIRIKLDQAFVSTPITSVRIFNRADCCSERLHDMIIRIGNSEAIEENPICGLVVGRVQGGDGGAANVECETPLRGKFITLQIKGPAEILTVCEIQAFQSSSAIKFGSLTMPYPVEPVDIDNPDCQDNDHACRMYAAGGECWKNPSWMLENCRRSCAVCVERRCHDMDPDCSLRASKGECDSKAAWMTANCPVSCGSCQEACADFHPNCASWAMLKECDNNPGWMSVNCKKSCQLCGDPSCVDSDRRCPYWKSLGDCLTHPDWMRDNCANSCNGCDNKCADTTKKCPVWAKAKECVYNPAWMSTFCRKSCSTCLNGTVAICEDEKEECAAWAGDGECEANPDFMLTRCERSCGACGPLKPTVDPNACEDKNKNCAYWEALGECSGEKQDFMKENCPRSCLVCTSDPIPCGDMHDNCATWADGGECITNAGWMWANCRKSCHICGDDDKCVENDERCGEWAKEGQCEANPHFMLKSCQKSCGVCDESHVCKNEEEKCYPWAHMARCTKEPEFMNRKCRKACNLCGCVNRQPHCDSWADAGECESNPTFMQVHCRKSCGTCEGGAKRTTTSPATPSMTTTTTTRKPTVSTTATKKTTTTKSPIVVENCINGHHYCAKHAKDGMCTVEDPGWRDWMRSNCPRACGYCDPTTSTKDPSCADVDRKCNEYECENSPDWAWEYCQKSCGFCN